MTLVSIGKILSPHGIYGHFKVQSFMEQPEDLFSFNSILIDQQEYSSKGAWAKKRSILKPDLFIAASDFIHDRTQADLWKNKEIQVYRYQLPDIVDQWYYADLIGKTVEDVLHESIGVVTKVTNFGGGDILILDTEILVSFTYMHSIKEDKIILSINKKSLI